MVAPEVIDVAVSELCEYLSDNADAVSWRSLADEELVYHLAVCVLGSQTRYDVAVQFADELRTFGLLNPAADLDNEAEYEKRLAFVCSTPLSSGRGGLRFHNRATKMLASTIPNLWCEETRLARVLRDSDDAEAAREWLVRNVNGFGPKQASLFLRRIGYSSDLAVLDRHVVRYLELVLEIKISDTDLSRLTSYEQVERQFRTRAMFFGHPVGVFDLAVWITMRVARRNGLL